MGVKFPFTVTDPDMYDPDNSFRTDYDPDRGGWYKKEESANESTEGENQ